MKLHQALLEQMCTHELWCLGRPLSSNNNHRQARMHFHVKWTLVYRQTLPASKCVIVTQDLFNHQRQCLCREVQVTRLLPFPRSLFHCFCCECCILRSHYLCMSITHTSTVKRLVYLLMAEGVTNQIPISQWECAPFNLQNGNGHTLNALALRSLGNAL